MMESVKNADGVFTRATVGYLGVFLDNWAIIELAKGNATRRERVIRAFHDGADLMFSPVNAAEILGPSLESSTAAIKSFLDAIGPHWFPMESDIVAVLDREAKGASGGEVCTANWFVDQFLAAHNLTLHGEQRVEQVESEFFRLGFVMEWLASQRERLRGMFARHDKTVQDSLNQLRGDHARALQMLHKVLPPIDFNPAKPATFAWQNVMRTVVREVRGHPLKDGDVADLCHAVIGSAYARLATLDKHWKRRVENLPEPNGLARIYYRQELDALVDDLEASV